MKFASKADKSTVIYNHAITIKGIPLEAYEYVVNGKLALEWVMERQGVSTHKDSGIVNDANDWAVETVKNVGGCCWLFFYFLNKSECVPVASSRSSWSSKTSSSIFL